MNKTFQWNGEKFPFSALDAETMRKFVPEAEKMQKAFEDYEKEAGLDGYLNADGVIAECKIADTFLDNLLGEGAAKKMFKGYDMGERLMAVKKLSRLRQAQLDEYNQSIEEGWFV